MTREALKRVEAGLPGSWYRDPAHYQRELDSALWEITNRQDARNCEWQQQGLQSREFVHGVYVPQEFDAHRFAQWVREGLAANASGASR
ncbi:MAG: hypothetical protein EPO20_09870 [Betaproteobacteria bacterium]|nr:MAG: hypothetical protein EPO20_09870 [Betaproteobacteria bacterium]